METTTIHLEVARGIVGLISGQKEQSITIPLDSANPREVALLLYKFQRLIDKISVPKRGNEITVSFG